MKLFGTDGIRGRAGVYPLDRETVFAIGRSVAIALGRRSGREPKFVIGRDTRESGPWIEQAFLSGASASGATGESAGVITTPGVAYLTSAFGFDAGIVVSASHNPFDDNGIKVFLPSGQKLDGDAEAEIETLVEEMGAGEERVLIDVDAARVGEFRDAYLDHIASRFSALDLHGSRIVLDCANGAATGFAPALIERFGADVIAINASPNGKNINEDCGSLHLEGLQATVLKNEAVFGVALDGDADRALFIDEKGSVVDGDATLWIIAQYLQAHGKLANSTVVATVMSNIGLELALKSNGIDLLRTDVGDKYVLEKLIETESEIGGEQSGHFIFPEFGLVGDGMMTALLMLRAVNELGVSLSAATKGFERFPQTLKNVRVKEKRSFDDISEIVAVADEVRGELHGEGRLLLRYSGTENLARVMIEGKDQTVIEAQAERLAVVIRTKLG